MSEWKSGYRWRDEYQWRGGRGWRSDWDAVLRGMCGGGVSMEAVSIKRSGRSEDRKQVSEHGHSL